MAAEVHFRNAMRSCNDDGATLLRTLLGFLVRNHAHEFPNLGSVVAATDAAAKQLTAAGGVLRPSTATGGGGGSSSLTVRSTEPPFGSGGKRILQANQTTDGFSSAFVFGGTDPATTSPSAARRGGAGAVSSHPHNAGAGGGKQSHTQHQPPPPPHHNTTSQHERDGDEEEPTYNHYYYAGDGGGHHGGDDDPGEHEQQQQQQQQPASPTISQRHPHEGRRLRVSPRPDSLSSVLAHQFTAANCEPPGGIDSDRMHGRKKHVTAPTGGSIPIGWQPPAQPAQLSGGGNNAAHQIHHHPGTAGASTASRLGFGDNSVADADATAAAVNRRLRGPAPEIKQLPFDQRRGVTAPMQRETWDLNANRPRSRGAGLGAGADTMWDILTPNPLLSSADPSLDTSRPNTARRG